MSILSTIFPTNTAISRLFPNTAPLFYSMRTNFLTLIALHEPSNPQLTPLRITLSSDLFETTIIHQLASWSTANPNASTNTTQTAIATLIAQFLLSRNQDHLAKLLNSLPIPTSKH